MPIYTARCLGCGMKRDFTFHKPLNMDEFLLWIEHHGIRCAKCDNGLFEKVPHAPSIKINGFNERNGYGLREKK